MSEANTGQHTFWNDVPGRAWVAQQPAMDLLMTNVTALVMAEAAPLPGQRVLDVGCGAGALTLAAARAVGPQGRALGVDISAPLLARAGELARVESLAQVKFLRADAQDHGFAPAAFDLVLSRFGVMFFADPVAAFANLAGAMRPGGRMVLAVWGRAVANPFFATPGRIGAARLGPPPPSDPDGPGPMAFSDIPRVLGILRAAGLRAEGRAVELTLDHPGGIEPVLDLLSHLGGLPRLLRETGGTAAMLAALREEWSGLVGDDGCLRVPAEINLYTATRV
ncbi:class I SAM-dependent methyltransferase [Tabrizicola sp.]|uniref:class I SAM-dependent methyltransferase n=1 Tax=Tabrizicola sp. TaxID=2005166 RepID=UPI002FDE1442